MPFDTWSHTLLNYREQGITGVAWTVFCPKDLQPKETTLPTGQEIVELNGTNVTPFIDEPYMVDSSKFKYNVHFYYATKTKPEEYWKQEGKYWSRDIEKFMGKKDGVAEQVNQLVAASDTPEQKVQKIYSFVAGLENQSFMAHRTSQEQKVLGLKDNGVSDILKQKSGDRNELTLLLRHHGSSRRRSRVRMVVTSRDNDYFEPNYLDFRQLDWDIAIVNIDGKEVFLIRAQVLPLRHARMEGYCDKGRSSDCGWNGYRRNARSQVHGSHYPTDRPHGDE